MSAATVVVSGEEPDVEPRPARAGLARAAPAAGRRPPAEQASLRPSGSRSAAGPVRGPTADARSDSGGTAHRHGHLPEPRMSPRVLCSPLQLALHAPTAGLSGDGARQSGTVHFEPAVDASRHCTEDDPVGAEHEILASQCALDDSAVDDAAEVCLGEQLSHSARLRAVEFLDLAAEQQPRQPRPGRAAPSSCQAAPWGFPVSSISLPGGRGGVRRRSAVRRPSPMPWRRRPLRARSGCGWRCGRGRVRLRR